MDQLVIQDTDLKGQFSHFVPILVENDDSWEKLKTKYPEILGDLTSARFNPTCSCRHRVASFLNEKYEFSSEDKNYIGHLFMLPEISKKALDIIKKIKSEASFNENFPRVHTIPKGEQAWRDFTNLLKNNNFPLITFSILEKDENNITVYLM
jgi:hypothetical protein